MEDQNFLTKLRPVEPKASKYAELDDSSSSDSEKLSSDDLKHGVTKKIKKMARRKKKYRFITDEMRVMLVDAVDNGEKIKHAAKRLKINYSSAKSIFKVFKREGRFSKKVLKPKAPPKAKPAPKMKDESAFSEQSEEIDDDEEESLDSPEQSCNPFLKKEPEEEKENIKQELNSPVPVAEPEAVQMPSETLDMRPAEVDTGIFLQQLHQKQQRQQRNYQSFGLPFGNMVAPKVSPNMLPSPFMGGTPSNQGISFSNLYAQQQQMNFQKPQFGAANMLSGLKPNNFNGLEASYQHFGNLIPQQQQNMSQMNYPSMLGNVYNQQQQQQQQQILLQQMNYQQNPYSYQNNVRFGPNMNYLEAMMAREQGFRMEEMNSNVVKFEYSDI